MTIIERSKVVEAYRRAMALLDDEKKACATVAWALGLPADLVSTVVREAAEVTS